MHHFRTLLLLVCSTALYAQANVNITTAPMLGSGDRADDPAIWVHPNRPAASIVIGVNKSGNLRDGGLYAFDLNGTRARDDDEWTEGTNLFDKGERYNNVDLRYGFPAGSERWDLVCASNRSDRELDVFRVVTDDNGDFLALEEVGEVPLGDGFAGEEDAPYGLALFQDRRNGNYYVLTSDKEGGVAQYRLDYNPMGSGDERIVGTRVTGVIDVSGDGSEVEGIVADDERGVIYIAAEDKGIFRYATNGAGVLTGARVPVALVEGSEELAADVEGLTLYYRPDGEGYLIASVQGRSRYAVYERSYSGSAPNRFLKDFAINGVENTDGLDVTNVNLGGQFASGLLVVHDGVEEGITRYKYVDWGQVAGVGSPDLAIDTRCDPRTGCPDVNTPESPDLSGSYTLRNSALGGQLTASSATGVALRPADGSLAQEWDVVRSGNGRYRLKNRQTGNWLGARGEETIYLEVRNLGANESWTLRERGPDTYTLLNFQTDRYLDGDPGGVVGLSNSPRRDDEWVLERIRTGSVLGQPATTGLVFPNPARQTITLAPELERITTVTIFDARGQQILQQTNPRSRQLDVSRLPVGVYLLRVAFNDSWEAVARLVVSR